MGFIEGQTPDTRGSEFSVSTKLYKIVEKAREEPKVTFTSLWHFIDVDFLKGAYRRTRKDGSPGIDNQTADEYARYLEDNLSRLSYQVRDGSYKAPPVRRRHIPKGKTKTRPIGVPTFEDKLLQRAVCMILNAIYEQDFLDCSHGFRPKRSPHTALLALRKVLMNQGGGWIYEVDVRSYFDTIDHKHLRSFLDQRVRDGILRKLIHKWLKAGVMEEGKVVYPEAGSPQGGVISPILSNVYLHEVLDKWFEVDVKPRMRGAAHLIRFADDFVIVFEHLDDAKRVQEVLSKRLARFGLSISPQKTRLVEFLRPWRKTLRKKTNAKFPTTFDFVGFTFYWRRSRRGKWVVGLKTASKKYSQALNRIYDWCKVNRHKHLWYQHKKLCQKLQGHYAYYGITGNGRALGRFRWEVICIWRKWLLRRSQRKRYNWQKYLQMIDQCTIPAPRIVHSYYSTIAKL